MPAVRDARAIATLVTVNNIMDGSPFSRVGGRGARVTVFMVSDSVTSATAILSSATVIVGSDILVQNGSPTAVGAFGAAAGGQLKVPEHVLTSGIAAPGDPITVSITNGSAGTVSYMTLVRIENL